MKVTSTNLYFNGYDDVDFPMNKSIIIILTSYMTLL